VLEIRCRYETTYTVLELEGEVCLLSVPVLRDCVDSLVDIGQVRLVIDLAEVTLLTAAAVNLFVSVAARLEALGGSLLVRRASGLPATVLELTGLDPRSVVTSAPPPA